MSDRNVIPASTLRGGTDPVDAVVEHPPVASALILDRREYDLRIRQQEILAELGVAALERRTFSDLMTVAVQLAAEGLEAQFCKILEYLPSENQLRLIAGIGWNSGCVGVATVGADLASPSGFALRTGKPVISNHLENEERFRTPELLQAHGIRRAINVILQGNGAPFGVLEVDSRDDGEFSERDLTFLQGAANVLGMAIERQRFERELQSALEHHQVLIKEINHRVKNSLQLVSSLFNLQIATSRDASLTEKLRDALARVSAVARVHERLYRSADVATVELGGYLKEVCQDLSTMVPGCTVHFSNDEQLVMSTDRAVKAALLTTELVTNAAKHATDGTTEGQVYVALTAQQGTGMILSVKDGGPGLPDGFDVDRSGGLGMKIVRALVAQLQANVTTLNHRPGFEYILEIPLRSSGSGP